MYISDDNNIYFLIFCILFFDTHYVYTRYNNYTTKHPGILDYIEKMKKSSTISFLLL
jgi:hypothetical protein